MLFVVYPHKIGTVDLNDVTDVEEFLVTIAEESDEFIGDYGEWNPPCCWDCFHDMCCDQFETDEEYEEFKSFIEDNSDVPFPEIEAPEDPNQAGWDAWYSSRGI